ncbi:FkbM family methyltransferase [Streptomyces sp. NBC_00287]|uniref:FkbM family methyltransferase n=1 Tax=Streptomyces sp. NBC_00287 TaxID=2975702 RepID=UPI002E2951EF|nr:FkbM family methyltransferase [Streptomyces sp. NBC_00287]
MQTLYRRLLQLMPRFGVRVTDLAPGTSLVSRRGRYTVKAAGKDAWMVLRGAPSAWTTVPLGESGARLVLGETSAADERKLQMAAAEYLCMQHVTAMLELYGVNCVLDVGANNGQYAKRLRKHGYRGRIVSFEPTEEAFARLSKAAEGDPNWQVHHCGLGRENTTAEIHVGWNTMNSLLPASDYGRDRYKRFHTTRTEQIRIRRLDAVLDEALDGIDDPRPFLKMDTQGYDLEVYAGAGERIADFVGLQSEVAVLRLYEGSPPMNEAVAAYEDGGFEITGMYPVTRERATGRVVEFDCVMMRAKAAPDAA